ncbi:MAG: gliding motility-associated C-terminal domain-containing protein, partial [Bacteroidota bacterium]
GRPTGDIILVDSSIDGCDSTVMVNLAFYSAPSSNLDTMICSGDTLRYQGVDFHADRPTGIVIIPGGSNGGCDSTVNVNLDFFPTPQGTLDTMICAGDTLRLRGEEFHANRLIGDVLLPDESAMGCDSIITVSLNFFAPAFSALDTTICIGDTLQYRGELFHLNRTAGEVIIPNASSNGCDSTIQITLDFFPQPVGVFDTIICAGTSFSYGNVEFSGAVEDQLVTINEPTRNGCDSLVAVTVRVRDLPQVNITGDGITCVGEEVDITINYDGPAIARVVLSSNPGDTIEVVSGPTTIQRPVPVGQTISILHATDGGPCAPATSGSITVTETDMAVGIQIISGDGVFAISCANEQDGAIVANASGGDAPYDFLWNTGATEPALQNLGAGEYDVMVTSSRGCQSGASVSLASPEIMAVAIDEVAANCVDTLPALVVSNIQGGIPPYAYGLAGGPGMRVGSSFPDTLQAPIGETTFLVEDANGCALNQTFNFEAAPKGELIVTPARSVIQVGDSVALAFLTDLNINGFRVIPGPEELIEGTSLVVSPSASTTYTIMAVDDQGCSAESMAEIIVDRYIPVYAPNAFSPNEDGSNELFRIYGGDRVRTITDFSIFNRWGHLVYNFPGPVGPDEVNWGWDGRDSRDGRLHEQDVYVYSVKVTLIDGRELTIKGDLALIR